MKRHILFLFSFILLMLFLYMSGIESILKYLSYIDLKLVPLFLIVIGVSFLIRVFRWRYMLSVINIKISFIKSFYIYFVGLFASNITPGKIGDLTKSYMLKKIGYQASLSLSSIIMERSSDVGILILFLISGILTSEISSPFFILTAMIFSLILIFVLYIVSNTFLLEKIINWAGSLINLILKNIKALNININGKDIAKNISSSFMVYRGRKLLFIIFISFIIWALEGALLYLSFKSIGVNSNIELCLIILSCGLLGGILSFLPGGIGSTEIIMSLIAQYLFQISGAEATTGIIIYRIFSFYFSMFVGTICIWKLKF